MQRRQLVLGSLLPALASSAYAQVGANVSRIIVPFAAGGAREAPARAIQQELNKETGQNWIVEPRPGAGGAIGTVAVARAEPDGKTLLMAASSHFVTAAMGAKPFYDPIKEFAPVANIGNQSYVLMISASLPARTMAEFIQHAKAHPGALSYSSAGISSSTHLAMAYLARSADIDMLHVPYKGTQEAANDVAAGRVSAVMVPTAGVGVYQQDARLRILGVTSRKRSHVLPKVPAIADSGLPQYVFESWFGLLAPAATPRPVLDKLNAAVNKVIATKEVTERLQRLGIEPSNLNVDGFNKAFAADRDLMFRIVKESGITRE